jgi:hypothetical protein
MFKHLILSQLYLVDDAALIEIIPVTVLFLTSVQKFGLSHWEDNGSGTYR